MFFQNPFGEEFRESWPIDQQARFFIEANRGNIAELCAFNAEYYDFSIVNTLTINFAFDPERKAYTAVAVNVAGATPAATMASEVADALNADPTFSDKFVAFIANANVGVVSAGPPYRVMIRCKKPRQDIRFYISNSGAETKLLFNKIAKVKELPSYFERHTVDNRFTYPDSQACLIKLDPLDPVDAQIITDAGLDPLTPLTDWEMLHGRSNTHTFTKLTHDGSGRVTETIEYFSGAVVGDMAKKTQYTYTGASTAPDQITMIPYTLQSGDLVTPP